MLLGWEIFLLRDINSCYHSLFFVSIEILTTFNMYGLNVDTTGKDIVAEFGANAKGKTSKLA